MVHLRLNKGACLDTNFRGVGEVASNLLFLFWSVFIQLLASLVAIGINTYPIKEQMNVRQKQRGEFIE
jgi:hypothetical protein